MSLFEDNKKRVIDDYERLINRKNAVADCYNGIYDRYVNPVLTADHAPYFWKYDMDPKTNPYFMERLGINAVLNSGALYMNGKYYLVARVEGNDRKSFFAVAESDKPTEGFRFHDYPVLLPDTERKKQTYMICVLLSTRMAGFTVYSAQRARTRTATTFPPL